MLILMVCRARQQKMIISAFRVCEELNQRVCNILYYLTVISVTDNLFCSTAKHQICQITIRTSQTGDGAREDNNTGLRRPSIIHLTDASFRTDHPSHRVPVLGGLLCLQSSSSLPLHPVYPFSYSTLKYTRWPNHCGFKDAQSELPI